MYVMVACVAACVENDKGEILGIIVTKEVGTMHTGNVVGACTWEGRRRCSVDTSRYMERPYPLGQQLRSIWKHGQH